MLYLSKTYTPHVRHPSAITHKHSAKSTILYYAIACHPLSLLFILLDLQSWTRTRLRKKTSSSFTPLYSSHPLIPSLHYIYLPFALCPSTSFCVRVILSSHGWHVLNAISYPSEINCFIIFTFSSTPFPSPPFLL